MWLLTANVEKNEKEKTAIVGEKEREEMKLRSKQLYELGKEIENETEKNIQSACKEKKQIIIMGENTHTYVHIHTHTFT